VSGVAAGPGSDAPLISARDLTVSFGRGRARREVLHRVSFDVHPGRVLALVGESGSGKSVLSRTLVGLTGERAKVEATELRYRDLDLLALSDRQWRGVRGREIGFVSQDALVSFDPLRTIGREIADTLRLHSVGDREERRRRVLDALREAGLRQPEEIAHQRAEELSGGMRQRALIASAMAAEPRILIADEPTTALDTTVQAQILALFASLVDGGRTLVFVSHDLAVVGQLADDLAVLREGEIVEQGPAERILADPQHEYTKLLLTAVPTLHGRGERLSAAPLPPVEEAAVGDPAAARGPAPAAPAVRVDGLVKRYEIAGGGSRLAVDDASFELAAGTTLGLVGESGAGKSTVAGVVLGTVTPDRGRVWIGEREWTALSEAERRPLRPRLQMIYQDPLSSFDPRHTVARVLGDALAVVGLERRARRERARELLHSVGLGDRQLDQHPLQLSGGQRQRVAIARALATDPEVILCDEPVSAVDASIQAQILDLLLELQRELGISYLFISHDLGVIRHVSDTVVVMREGQVVEQGPAATVLGNPQHAYTKELLAAVPVPTRRLRARPAPAPTLQPGPLSSAA
jgi:peptide/nickel transport system ATP-binding protein